MSGGRNACSQSRKEEGQAEQEDHGRTADFDHAMDCCTALGCSAYPYGRILRPDCKSCKHSHSEPGSDRHGEGGGNSGKIKPVEERKGKHDQRAGAWAKADGEDCRPGLTKSEILLRQHFRIGRVKVIVVMPVVVAMGVRMRMGMAMRGAVCMGMGMSAAMGMVVRVIVSAGLAVNMFMCVRMCMCAGTCVSVAMGMVMRSGMRMIVCMISMGMRRSNCMSFGMGMFIRMPVGMAVCVAMRMPAPGDLGP
jgi:hypothetical protein